MDIKSLKATIKCENFKIKNLKRERVRITSGGKTLNISSSLSHMQPTCVNAAKGLDFWQPSPQMVLILLSLQEYFDILGNKVIISSQLA